MSNKEDAFFLGTATVFQILLMGGFFKLWLISAVGLLIVGLVMFWYIEKESWTFPRFKYYLQCVLLIYPFQTILLVGLAMIYSIFNLLVNLISAIV